VFCATNVVVINNFLSEPQLRAQSSISNLIKAAE
jgi:hypothetical protein